MSLIRTGIVLGIGVALLPSDPASQRQLYERTASAVHWTATFCERNAVTCTNAAELWDAFVVKAQFAGELAYEAYIRYTADSSASSLPLSNASHTQDNPATRGTLSTEDLRPVWRAPVHRQGI